MSNRIKVFTPNASNQVKIVEGEQTLVKVVSTGPQGPPGPSSIFKGGNVEDDVIVSGSFTFLGTTGPLPQSFIKIDGGMTVTGSHYSASIQHTASFGRLEIAGDSRLDGNVTIGGNINIGDANTDSLTISSDLSSSIIPDIDGTFDLGTTAKNWKFGYIEQVTSTHVTASGNISGSSISTASFGELEVDTNATIDGDLFVSQYIKHKGDEDTFINFTDNRIRLKAGDIGFFDMEQDGSTPYPATINPGGNRVNFRVVDRNTDLLLKTDSEAFNVGLYYAGNQKLETVVGGINVTGHVTASGNISGSVTSTGSFGRVQTSVIGGNSPLRVESDNFEVDGNGSITFSGNISGSSTTTGSFGNLRISGLSVPDLKVMSSSLSSRLSAEETNIDALQLDSGSFSTRITNATASIAGLKTDSGSFSTRITDATSSIAGLKVDSGSFSSRTTTLEGSGTIQGVGTSNTPTFAGLTSTGDVTIQGKLTAEVYAVSSSVTHMTRSFSSGSTIFGDTQDDTHEFTGSLNITGSVSALNYSGIFNGALSSSAQISSDISGSFTSVSSSFDTRLTNATASIQGLKTDSGSFSTRITNATASIAGLKTDSGSFNTRITNATASIAGLKTDSGSLSLRITNATSSIAGLVTDSGSFSTRITNATASIAGLKTDSGSFSTRLTTEEANVDALQTDSGSFSTRITNATASITDLKTDSGSFSTRITNATASIAGLKTDSGSISTRITTIETNAGGQALNTTDSPTFAGLTTTGDVVVQGTLTAETYIVSSSVTTMSVQQASGSTIFGDSLDDTHQITGSLLVTGSINAVSFIGDGSQLTGITSVTTESIQNLKSGIISGSEQLPSGIISGSSQLPSGLVSGSSQIVSISDTAPSNPVQGDLWWKSDDGNMYVYYDGYWVISIDTTTIIPSGTVSGSSQITDVVTQTYVSSSAAAAGFGSSGNFSLLDLETAVVDSSTTSILDITFITDSNGDLIKSSG